ncbi:undecaprenyl-diphosphate phosphatase [Shouchella clausii]|jgi:undecaprenyl-diphosphatase|uniref:undecaprenyl-diphosphate phosphatase n=1 Tax=Shouchella clausii TaxID=79880 RepID=UPI000B96C919|nr:undecaprenyl-diphosphate phosphatase [Shouchella clausii]SPU21862.1 UDP pyrophosphate phosphatase [Niallia circulans]AST97993.1 undecaprenyl-diphosphatase [Shouchella clausii]MBU8597196.1 undecaprenyl-diphosphate phosphatase [Shouchella clausii]MCM3551195.1 undecaprenyl-diphosphate phosphatase [Shouchella clausii]MCR1290205.1 undecaprenyl-diphosphate phosphatase [Shouchella clausii]
MSLLEAVILGLVQGITEFLPISSSAHLIIVQSLFGMTFAGFSFEILLHLASVLAVILYYRHDLIEIIRGFFAYFTKRTPQNKAMFWFAIYLVIATGITGVAGILFEDYISETFKAPIFIALALAVTGLFLIIIERFVRHGNRTEKEMTIWDSIIVGLGQCLALIPGLSRSGTTLIVGMFAGLTKETAVRFSFLLSIPVILGSSVLAIDDLISGELLASTGLFELVASFVVTFIASWLGIVFFLNLVRKSKLVYFAVYCFIVAILVFIFQDTLGHADI